MIGKRVKYSLVGLLCVVSVSLFAVAESPDFKLGRNMEILINMFRDLNLFYVDKVDPDQMLADAVGGMVRNLDPYTEYIPAEEMSKFELLTTGKYGGIGSLIREKGDYIVIAQPYKGFPADRAGLQIGDKIVEIQGEDAKGFTSEKVSSMLKGDPGTSVKLKVEKFYSGQIVPLTIKRERIAISGIPYYGFVSDSIGYIQHSDFTEDCSNDMRKALMELQGSGKLKGLILDYRGNGGGILQEAVKILSLFVPNGTEVVSMRGKQTQMDAKFKTESEPMDIDVPIVVLTNSGSASAAEIVSGAIQDLDRGVLLGQRTYGKGLVQSTRPVGFNSYLKLTTAKYYMPSGRCIQAIDYAHRNEDGSVGYVPDSLIREFTTKAGRKIYDGGGVMPDVKTVAEYVSRFAMIVYGKGFIEDFVDIYCKKHAQGVSLSDFKLTDADYAEFVEFMADKDVEYESQTKQALADLKMKAIKERYIDKVEEYIAKIETELKDDKPINLTLNRAELSQIIEDEIVLRSHYSQGVAARNLTSDSDVKAAIDVLCDRTRYDKITKEQDTERK